MRIAKILVTVCLLTNALGGAVDADIPNARISSDQGFVDIDLSVTDVTMGEDGTVSVTARGNVSGTNVGFIVDVLPIWTAKKMESGAAVLYWGKVRYRSIGAESDNFVSLVARLYGVSAPGSSMAKQINFAAVGLNTDPRNVLKSPTRMKVFFESPNQNQYAEVFTNLDLSKRLVQFHEKDQEYRIPLIRALGDGA